MNDPALYAKINHITQRDAIICLDEFSSKIKWKKNNRVLDIGCADGSVTNILKKYIPADSELIGCDINEKMVNFANEHYCNEQTSFTVLDIAGDLPETMKGKFDHVFSFYTLHWIINHERAFTNIYNLLENSGECFVMFLANTPVYDSYRRLAQNSKWSTLLKDTEKYISPYHDIQEPDKEIRKIVDKVGFVDIHVECKHLSYEYDNIPFLKATMKAVNPFTIPEESYDAYVQDHMEVFEELQVINKSNLSAKLNYSLLIVHARKPS